MKSMSGVRNEVDNENQAISLLEKLARASVQSPQFQALPALG
jgi:hypothetical protein